MDDLYTKISQLCDEANINITRMCKDTGVSRGALSDLKIGRTKSLSSSTLQKIASYFNLSVDYFLGANNTIKKTIKKEDGDSAPSSESNLSLSLQKLYDFASTLSEDQISDILDYMEFKQFQKKKKEKTDF